MPKNTYTSGNPYVKAFNDALGTFKDFSTFLADPGERQGIRQGFTDAVNRGAVAGALGAPVDLTNAALNIGKAAVGYLGNKAGVLSADQMPQLIDNPVGGSEYIGNQMRRLGMVSPNRNALAEGLAGVLPVSPFASGKAVAALAGGGVVPGIGGVAPQIAAGLLKMGENAAARATMNPQAGMLRIPGRGQIPETATDVKKLSDRFGRLLDDAGVEYAYDKSGLSPARYFTFDRPASLTHTAQDIQNYGPDIYKVRISDHRNVHGADFSVDPHTGATFEEMLTDVKNLGVPIADKVRPKNTVADQVRKLQNQLLNGSYIRGAAKNLPPTASREEIFAEAKKLETEIFSIANLDKSQLNKQHLDRLKQMLPDKP